MNNNQENTIHADRMIKKRIEREQKLIALFNTWYLSCIRGQFNIGPVNRKLINLWCELENQSITEQDADFIVVNYQHGLSKHL